MFPEFKDPGVHRRRRWFYGLWVLLLGLSGWALFLWGKPKSVDRAKVRLTITAEDLPPGTQLRLWAGPIKTLRNTNPDELLKAAPDLPASIRTLLPDVQVSIARRRWVKATIPGGTTEALVVRFAAPGQSPRYFFYDLREDIESGLLANHRVLYISNPLAWNHLNPDPGAFSRVR